MGFFLFAIMIAGPIFACYLMIKRRIMGKCEKYKNRKLTSLNLLKIARMLQGGNILGIILDTLVLMDGNEITSRNALFVHTFFIVCFEIPSLILYMLIANNNIEFTDDSIIYRRPIGKRIVIRYSDIDPKESYCKPGHIFFHLIIFANGVKNDLWLLDNEKLYFVMNWAKKKGIVYIPHNKGE